MGFPSKLKDFRHYIDGFGYAGVIAEVTLPKLALKTEDWRAGGMLGPMKIDLGLDAMEATITFGGLTDAALRQFGTGIHDGVLNRFAGAYQEDGSGTVRALEVFMLGRWHEIDMGTAKVGADTSHKAMLNVAYYRMAVDGVDWIEIDLVNGVFIVMGTDRWAQIRAAVGG